MLKEVNIGEADKIITVFTRGYGKLSAVAKGARRPKSKLVACSQFLCYSDFVLFKGRELFTVTSCDVIEPFYEIRNDIERLTYSAHLADIISDIIQENQPSAKVLQLLLNTLYVLSKTEKSPELITTIFEIRLLALIGYAPHVISCMMCGAEDINNMCFSFKECGLVCQNSPCSSGDHFATRISPAAIMALRHIIYSKMNDLFNFDLSPVVLAELSRISKRYLRERLEKDYKKLDFLKTLKG